MRLLFLNPNSTQAMTDSMVEVARNALPGTELLGWTNHDGPPAIQGPEDGAAAVAGLMALLPKAQAAAVDAIVIGCFDDTGLGRLRDAAQLQEGRVLRHVDRRREYGRRRRRLHRRLDEVERHTPARADTPLLRLGQRQQLTEVVDGGAPPSARFRRL